MSIKYKRPMPIMLEGDVVEAPDWYLRAVAEAEANKIENERRRGLARVHLLNIESPMDIAKGLYYLATSNANEEPRIVYANTPAIAINPGGAVTTIPRAIRWLLGLATTGVTLNNVKDALKSFTITIESGKKKKEAESTTTDTATPPSNNDNKTDDKKNDKKDLKEEKPKDPERWKKRGKKAAKVYGASWAISALSDVAGNAIGAGTLGDDYVPLLKVLDKRAQVEKGLLTVVSNILDAIGKQYTANPSETQNNSNLDELSRLLDAELGQYRERKRNGSSNN